MTKISHFLWYDNQAEEAAKLYTSVFKDSRINKTVTVQGAGPGGNGVAQLVEFEINGDKFTAFNGGPHHTFNDAISIVVHCDTQEEIDHYWSSLTADGGAEVACGWLKDKFGLCWQIVPNVFTELAGKGDGQRTGAMMKALHGMKKLIIADLVEAYNR